MRTSEHSVDAADWLILAHGAGSSADFLSRAFPAAACGTAAIYLDDRTGRIPSIASRLTEEAARRRSQGRRVLIGGVSIGAHAAAHAAANAAAGTIDGLVLALPAWTGSPPGTTPTRAAAVEVAEVGGDAVLRRLIADPVLGGDWVVNELNRAWSGRASLAAELAAAAAGEAPTLAQLRGITAPTLVLGLSDDPFHPMEVAEEWATAIPQADLRRVSREAPGRDLAVFGRSVGAWLASQAR